MSEWRESITEYPQLASELGGLQDAVNALVKKAEDHMWKSASKGVTVSDVLDAIKAHEACHGHKPSHVFVHPWASVSDGTVVDGVIVQTDPDCPIDEVHPVGTWLPKEPPRFNLDRTQKDALAGYCANGHSMSPDWDGWECTGCGVRLSGKLVRGLAAKLTKLENPDRTLEQHGGEMRAVDYEAFRSGYHRAAELYGTPELERLRAENAVMKERQPVEIHAHHINGKPAWIEFEGDDFLSFILRAGDKCPELRGLPVIHNGRATITTVSTLARALFDLELRGEAMRWAEVPMGSGAYGDDERVAHVLDRMWDETKPKDRDLCLARAQQIVDAMRAR